MWLSSLWNPQYIPITSDSNFEGLSEWGHWRKEEEKATGLSFALFSVANQISWWNSVRASATHQTSVQLKNFVALPNHINSSEWGEAARGGQGWESTDLGREGEEKMIDKDKLWWKLSCKDGDYDEKDYQEQYEWDKGKEHCKEAV